METPETKFKPVSKLKTTLLLVFTFGLLGATIITAYLVQKPKEEISTEATAAPADLYLQPASGTYVYSPETTFDINIVLNANGNPVRGSDVSLNFDPAYLEVVDIDSETDGIQVTPGTIFPDPTVLINQADNAAGRILLSIGTFDSFSGEGVFGTIKFRPKAASSAPTGVSFNGPPDTQIIKVGGEDITGTLTPGSYTISLEPAQLSFKIKFEGVNQQRPNQAVTIILKKDGSVTQTFENVTISSDTNGIYSGTAAGIAPDTYDVLVKGPVHLRKLLEADVAFGSGASDFDWSSEELPSGDATGDNKVNIQDFGRLAENYLQSVSIADFNLDGIVNIQDFGLLAENYGQEGED